MPIYGLNNVLQGSAGQPAKPDFKQMPVSPEVQNILTQQGHPQAANLGELQSFMNKLQQESPGKFNQLFDAMHPGLRGQGLDNLNPSVIQNIGR